MKVLFTVAMVLLGFTVVTLALYGVRHYALMFARLRLRRPRDFDELTGFYQPTISVLVPMRNEERVAADLLEALVASDYDRAKLEVLAINDRSEDNTGRIIDEYAKLYPFVRAIHRQCGDGGKAAALQLATTQAAGEVLILFDADYVPTRSTLKQLAAPFCDPEVGAVMGRVVPHNAGSTLLSAMLSLERAAGYQIGQQARYNLGLTPQFGGTVGGVRASALKAVGGWNTISLTEDTDLTFRLLAAGWKVAYVNKAECYEEVPESWEVRKRQIARWAMGHTDCLHRLLGPVLRSKSLSTLEKADAAFGLACYLTAPVLVVGWLASLVLFMNPESQALTTLAVALAFTTYQVFGNQATFFELGAAALLDGKGRSVLLIPLNLFNFFASTYAICGALIRYYASKISGSGGPGWHKTKRFRNNGNGFKNGNGHGKQLFSQSANGLYNFTV